MFEFDIWEPFRKSENRTRPLLTYFVAVIILLTWFPMVYKFGDIIAAIYFMVATLAWSIFCRWKKWA